VRPDARCRHTALNIEQWLICDSIVWTSLIGRQANLEACE
jgi:hypothetical protein